MNLSFMPDVIDLVLAVEGRRSYGEVRIEQFLVDEAQPESGILKVSRNFRAPHECAQI
jgi:hypothetical protein